MSKLNTNENKAASSGCASTSCSQKSATPVMDKAAYEANLRTVGKWIVPLAKARKMEIERDHWRNVAKEIGRDYLREGLKADGEIAKLKAWIIVAAPMLSTAACIVVDAAVERLGEIEGVRSVLESCPVDFSGANAEVRHGAKDADTN